MEWQETLNASPFCNRFTDNGKGMDEALEQQRLAFATNLVCRLQQDGFVRICGHGISAAEISQVFQAVSKIVAFQRLPVPSYLYGCS